MDADEHRSTPGFVYGVAMRSSGMEEGVPPCACPCHVADRPEGAKGWYCDRCYAFLMCFSYPEKPRVEYTHEQAIADGKRDPRPYMVNVPDYFYITKGNTLTDELGEHFATEEKARARAERLNRADVLASLNLDPTAQTRRLHLQALGETFNVRYGEGHPEARWPTKLGRYAVEEYSDRYSESFWHMRETIEEVRADIADGDVERVVDLDTGADVPFKVTVEIAESAAMREP